MTSEVQVSDPLGIRDVIRFVDVLENDYVGKGKALPAAKVKEMQSIIEQFQQALVKLDVICVIASPTQKLGVQCLSIGQALLRGEGDGVDEQGFIPLGDIATELADELYRYATED